MEKTKTKQNIKAHHISSKKKKKKDE